MNTSLAKSTEYTLDQVEERYRQAVEAEPDCAIPLYDYAAFLHYTRQNFDAAGEYYKRALEVNPDYAKCHSCYAVYLETICKDYGVAEEHYKKSLEIEPKNAKYLYNYAVFLEVICKDYDKAEELYKMALEVMPDYPLLFCHYAIFLYCIRKDYEKANEHYKLTLQTLEPKCNANVELQLCNYCTISCDSTSAFVWLDRLDSARMTLQGQLLRHFFRFVLLPNQRCYHSQQIDKFLTHGVRAECWIFDHLLECEHIKNDPDYDKIKSFAERINEPFQNVYSVEEV